MSTGSSAMGAADGGYRRPDTPQATRSLVDQVASVGGLTYRESARDRKSAARPLRTWPQSKLSNTRDFGRRLQNRIVYGENVRQALQFAETGNADAAIVAWSLVKEKGGRS